MYGKGPPGAREEVLSSGACSEEARPGSEAIRNVQEPGCDSLGVESAGKRNLQMQRPGGGEELGHFEAGVEGEEAMK